MIKKERYLLPGQIGSLSIKNRLIRAATSETMADADGAVTSAVIKLYADLAAGGAGLLITGHAYVERRGQCSPNQIGVYTDAHIPGLAALSETVHKHGGKIFIELSHAGSQSVIPDLDALAPSGVSNAIFGRGAREMSAGEIDQVIGAFALGAKRAIEAGFDGIHVHGGNGYLISQFSSPLTNRRQDDWGGDAERRDRFFVEVLRAIRTAVGSTVPITARFGLTDSLSDGLTLDEGIKRAKTLVLEGLNALEPTYNLMNSYLENIRRYVGVTRSRALKDWLLPRLWTPSEPEAYYLNFAKMLKSELDVPVILVGGVRSTAKMTEILREGNADFFSMARPFVREPDFPNSLLAGRRGVIDCVSCNICLMHDGLDPLKCWRLSARDLAKHAYSRYWRDRHLYH
jgi:2,4-dienoyl-CoA reductase-like NADH-dependent reductase (Old Yellow Enzyme family)